MKKLLSLLFVIFTLFIFSEKFIYRDYNYYDYVEYLVKKGYIEIGNNDIPILVSDIISSMEETAREIESNVSNIPKNDIPIFMFIYNDLTKGSPFKIRNNFYMKSMNYDSIEFLNNDSLMFNLKNEFYIIGNMEFADIQIAINSNMPYGPKNYKDTIRALEWKGTKTKIDKAVVGLSYDENYIIMGRFLPAWGQGIFDNMFLSRNTESYDGLNFRLKKGILEFSYFAATLSPGHETFRDEAFTRYASFHKVGIYLPFNTYFAFKEIILYGSPIMETRYLNPFVVYYFTQWNGHADDNIIWSIELINKYFNGIPISFEMFIDDLQYDEDRKVAPDKVGIIGNVSIPVLIDGLYIDLEYALITKWTGTHEHSECVYDYYSEPMLYFIGPDSDFFGLRINYIFSNKISASYIYSITRSGEGTMYLSHEEEGGDPHPPFPSGIIEKVRSNSFSFKYNVFKWFDINCGIEAVNYYNRDNIRGINEFDLNMYLQGVIRL